MAEVSTDKNVRFATAWTMTLVAARISSASGRRTHVMQTKA